MQFADATHLHALVGCDPDYIDGAFLPFSHVAFDIFHVALVVKFLRKDGCSVFELVMSLVLADQLMPLLV